MYKKTYNDLILDNTDGKDAHALTASLSITGEYRNKYIRSSITHDIMVFYDGEQINSGYTIQWSYKGAGKEGESNSSNIFSSWTDEFPTFDTSIRRDGTPLQIRCKVSYKRLEFIATGNLPCIQDGADGVRGAMPNECGAYNPNYTYTSNTSLCDWVYDSSVSPNPNDAPWYACRQSCRGIPLSNPFFWIRVGTPKRIITPEMIAGKIKANQIESSAFAKRWMPLHEDYTAKDVYEYVKNGRNYYFILPKGDIHLPRLSNSSEIPVGTEISFLLPEDERDQKRYFKDAIPLRANFQDAGILQGNVNIGSAQLINICPIRCGVLHFQVAKSPTGKEWLWTNWSEFKNLDLLNEIRDIDKKAQRFISGGSRSIDANKISVIHCEDNLSSKSVLNLFNAHYGNDVTIIIPHWAMKGGSSLHINLFDGKSATQRCKQMLITSAGVYKIYFWSPDISDGYCARLSDTFIDCKEGDADTNTSLPNVNPWDLPGWWDDWKING